VEVGDGFGVVGFEPGEQASGLGDVDGEAGEERLGGFVVDAATVDQFGVGSFVPARAVAVMKENVWRVGC
jgi:hypothetical protein